MDLGHETYHSALYAGRGIPSVGRLRARNREGEALLSDKTKLLLDLKSYWAVFLRPFGALDYDMSLTQTDHLMIVWHHSLELENINSMRWRNLLRPDASPVTDFRLQPLN